MAVLGLLDVKPYLKMQTTDNDADVLDFIDAAEDLITQEVGPLEPLTFTERVVPGEDDCLRLPVSPLISVTSVTGLDTGTTVTVVDANLNLDAGIIRVPGVEFHESLYEVVFVAGRATCPPRYKQAAKELTRHLWRTQRGAGSRQGGEDLPGSAYTLPLRVQQLLKGGEQGGFA